MVSGDESTSVAGLRWLRRFWDGVIERGQVRRLCHELVAMHRAVAEHNPELSGERLYELIIMRLTNSDHAQARAYLNHVEESFAQWPVVREVVFRDVALYFVLHKSLKAHEQPARSQSDFSTIVYSIVPADL